MQSEGEEEKGNTLLRYRDINKWTDIATLIYVYIFICDHIYTCIQIQIYPFREIWSLY